ncbi:hypothetical protein Tco_0830758 [Tanacetum coccineum]
MDNKTNQSNPSTHEKPPMPPISSYSTVEGSAEEHDICDEYLTEGYPIKKELHQLMLDEEALRETLEEEARAQKEFDEINKRLEEARKEQAHDELFRLECGVKSDSEYESD